MISLYLSISLPVSLFIFIVPICLTAGPFSQTLRALSRGIRRCIGPMGEIINFNHMALCVCVCVCVCLAHRFCASQEPQHHKNAA